MGRNIHNQISEKGHVSRINKEVFQLYNKRQIMQLRWAKHINSHIYKNVY